MSKIPCPKCKCPSSFVRRMSDIVVTWNCDNKDCKMGGFSEYVWPEPNGCYTRLCEMDERRLRAAIETARISVPDLIPALQKELNYHDK